MNKPNFQYDSWVLKAIIGFIILISPAFLEFIFNFQNSNDSIISQKLLTKHFLKTSVIIFFVSSLIHTPFLFLRKKYHIIFLIIFIIGFYSISVLDLIHVNIFQSTANSSSFYSVFSTHNNESLEFISDYNIVKIIFPVFSLAIIVASFYILWKNIFQKKIKVFSLAIFILLSITGSLVLVKFPEKKFVNKISAFQFYDAYRQYKNELHFIQSYPANQKIYIQKKTFPQAETHIILIGESTGKYHMQLFGYNRNTNPELTKIKDKLILFENVKSSSVHTVSSLRDVLLLQDKNNRPISSTLIDLLKNSGFKTYWLSNQQYLGMNETLISAIAKRADKNVYLSPVFSNKYDGDLLPHVENILSDSAKKKVIFIHLMGTHLSYHERYPKEFNRFREKLNSPFGAHADELINEYDNAVFYNDFVVSQIIDKAEKIRGISSVLYFSDHGDEVYDFRDFHGHSESLLSKYMNSIPLIFFGNDAFIRAKDDKIKRMRNQVSQTYSLKNLNHTIQDLYDIKSEFYQREKSYLFGKGEETSGVFHDTLLKKFYYQSYFPIFPEKVWVHRVNSLERLKIIQEKFSGIELDAVYENGKIDVRHPPAESMNLSLEIYFANVKNIKNHYFWIDLKDVQKGKKAEMIAYLNKLTNFYQIKKNIIIENPDLNLLNELKKQGYYTSCYLPDLNMLSQDSLERKIPIIASALHKNKTQAISQSIENYPLMAEYLPHCNKLIWALKVNWKDEKERNRIYQVLSKDSTVKICLVNFHTAGWR